MKETQTKTIKIILIASGILLIFGVVGFLTYQYWSPLGKKITTSMKLPGAKEVANIDTTSPTGGFKLPSQVITSQAARFPLDIKSSNIENIHAIIKFKKGPKEIRLGIRGDEKDKYVYKPFYQTFIQDAQKWEQIKGTSNILYQRNKKYDSIVDLINTPPDKEKIGAYFVNAETLVKNTPTKIEPNTIINTYLRGTHTFYVWVDSAPFTLKVSKQDINMYDGEDKLKIAVYKENKKITEKEIPDDGMAGKTLLKRDSQTEKVELTDITPGIYRVDIVSDSKGGDTLITRIETNQQKIIAKRLFILDKKPSNIYTDATNLTAQIAHKGYLDSIKINDKYEIKILEVGKKVTTDVEALTKSNYNSKNLYKISSAKNDIVYTSDSYFAFSPDQFFNPEIIKKTELNTVESLDDIDYILTTLTPARQEGDWLVSEINFDPKDLNITGNKLYFSLESPELAKFGGELEIESFEVNIDYTGALEKFVKAPIINPTPEKRGFVDKIMDFFKNILKKNQPITSTNTPTPTTTLALKITPTAIATPSTKITPTITATPSSKLTPTSTTNKSVKIKVLNAGASAGAAARYATLLKTAGYSNTEAGNYDGSDIKNCTITYPEKYISTATDIEKILKTEYKTVNRAINYKDDQITINIGAIN
ncbi:MAG: LytR C-terminal domain-containing protein [Candidatus Shapirobacteria bacterium]|nr:LytR C-terminal domain-containing protein [Candidatus Shapirobacteria bacterium]